MRILCIAIRTLQLALIGLSLCVVLLPATRTPQVRFALMGLFSVHAVRSVRQLWQAGYLKATPAQVASAVVKGGPTVTPIDLLTTVMAVIGTVLAA